MEEPRANPYLRETVLTATPEQLHLMLYDGAIRFAAQGRDAILQKDIEGSYNKLTRAQQIIAEMLNGLDYDVNRELCERMASIYNFIYQKLVDACVHRTVQAVDDALTVLRYNRETWQLLVGKVNEVRAEVGRDRFESNAPPQGIAGLVAATAPSRPTVDAPSRPSVSDTLTTEVVPSPLSVDA